MLNNMLPILCSIVNIIEGFLYDHLSRRIFTMIINKVIHISSENFETNDTSTF